MTGVKLATAYYELIPSTAGAQADITRQFTGVGKSASKGFGGTFSRGLKATVGPAIALLGAASVGKFLKDSVGEAREAQKVGARTNNVIKTTGGVANISAKQVGRLSTAISNKTGIDDEAIQTGANLLLTFKNVRNEVGKSNKVFDRATQAAADLSASGFGDLNGASKQLGKALNDPVKGISALGRAGVTFTAGQKEQIANFVKANDLLSAQKIILGEVESQVGGSAAATSTLGEKASVAFGNFKESIGTALLPVLDDLNRKLIKDGVPAGEKFADFFAEKIVPGVRDFADTAGPLAESTLPAIGSALRSAGDAAKVLAPPVKAIIDAFNSLPKAVQSAVVIGGATAVIAKKTKGSSLASAAANTGGKGNVPLAAAAATLFAGGNILDSVDTAKRAQKSLEGVATSLADTYDKNGRATAASIQLIKDAFASGNVGKYAEDLGVDLDKLSRSFAQNGLDGKYVQETLKTLEDRYSTTKDVLDDPLSSVFGSTESSKIASFRNQLEKLGPEFTEASRGAYRAGNQTRDLTDLLLGGKGAAKGLGFDLDNLGKKNPKPKVSTPGLASSRDNTGKLIEKLLVLDGQKASPSVEVQGIAGALARVSALSSAIAAAAKKKLVIDAFAGGTSGAPGGVALVGERGPELVNLPRGTQVLPAGPTKRALTNSPSGAFAAGESADSLAARALASLERKMSRGFQIVGPPGNQRLVAAGA